MRADGLCKLGWVFLTPPTQQDFGIEIAQKRGKHPEAQSEAVLHFTHIPVVPRLQASLPKSLHLLVTPHSSFITSRRSL